MRYLFILLCWSLPLFTAGKTLHAFPSKKIWLAQKGEARFTIGLPPHTGVTQQFAASELVKYLGQISGGVFIIDSGESLSSPQISLKITQSLAQEAYTITVQGPDIVLTGGSGRAVLYAVYDFLGRLGCRWLAPAFTFYHGKAEIIPHTPDLAYRATGDIAEQPVFTLRKIDASGHAHNAEEMKKIIEWMPKLRYNTFMFPLNLNNNNRVQWDKWRGQLIQELKKRGLILEVGQHGYQDFLNADMEGGALFKKHPDWFGKDSSGNPSRSERDVFNTTNPAAVRYFIHNIVSCLRQHPEINIFDFWPPDGARWIQYPASDDMGSPEDRQAQLANEVDAAIKKIRPGLRLEIIAYDEAMLPPEKVKLNRDILVDFCPINQNFEKQIGDPDAPGNALYVKAIYAWRKQFPGDIGLYSYYRKSAWRSLPNEIPHYIRRDMEWYAGVPLQGISCYAYHDDWFTYELNHFILGQVAWDPAANVDSLVALFCRARYGPARKTAEAAYASLENIVRIDGSIPFSSLKPEQQVMQAAAAIAAQLSTLRKEKEKQSSGDTVLSANLSRLLLMFQYVQKDLEIQEARAAGMSKGALELKVKELLVFLQANRDKGVFLLAGTHNALLFRKHYGLTDQSLLNP